MLKISRLSLAIMLTLVFAGQVFPQEDICVCFVLTVTEPAEAVNAGRSLIFVADVKGVDNQWPQFDWSVDKGTIIGGQGGPRLEVGTNGLDGETVTATVQVSTVCESCTTTASGTGIVLSVPKPAIVDSFQMPACDDFMARMDSLFIHLSQDPAAKAYVFIYGNSVARNAAETTLKNYISTRMQDSARFIIVDAGSGGKKAHLDLWMVSAGADASLIPPRNDLEIEPDPLYEGKPLVVTSEFYDGIGCSSYDPDYFASLLLRDPKSRGNIVIYENNRKDFGVEEQKILKILAAAGISRQRLRTFYVQSKPGGQERGIELWYLP